MILKSFDDLHLILTLVLGLPLSVYHLLLLQ